MGLSPDAWITLATIGACFGFLIFTRFAADVILVAGVALLLILGILTPAEALGGLANEGMVTVAVLYIVAQALAETGVVYWISQNVLGRPESTRAAQWRLMGPVAVFSSVLNNTPVVAMLIPAVNDWAKRNNLSVSQLMIPLSYAAIIGGTCTLVGTSTNLVINGMLLDALPGQGLGMFDLAWVGIPGVVVVIGFTLLFAKWLLPSNKIAGERFSDAREYVVEMLVEPDSGIVNKTIEEAGLRQLPGMFLVEIVRDGRVLTAVAPREILHGNDRLVFAGDVRSVVDLKNMPGLKVAEDQAFKLQSDESARCLAEVVVAPSFPHLHQSVKDMRFRNRYGAAIIAVSRQGEHVKERIGDLDLQPGDTLLLETDEDFIEKQRYSRDFLLASGIENSRPVRHQLRSTSALIMISMVLAVALGLLSMLKAAIVAAVLMLVTRCVRIREARHCIDWQVLLVIAASIGLGKAMEVTGAAQAIADVVVGASSGSPHATLILVFLLTAVFSAVISNLAAAVLIFPVALAAALQLDASMIPFAVTLMVAASCCFATPIGYQTNLMVYGPGEYRFADYLKLGVPLTALVGVVTVLIVPLVWPF